MSRLLNAAVVITAVLFLTTLACAQQPYERTTIVEKFAPPVMQAPPIAKRVYAAPVMIEYRAVPMMAAPVYAVPMYGKTPVVVERYGLFGLRREVHRADGSSTRYGPLGRRR